MSAAIKRCSVGAVLALAAMLPDYQLLHTSPDGLTLLANLEGCRLRPYQCSAGVWTSGIGHTAGVIPQKPVDERQAAINLVADVLNVEKRLSLCVPGTMPHSVYDALVSFAFNVGSGAACKSTLVWYLNQRQWRKACEQLPRWTYINGVKSTGLENRRLREQAWCMQEVQ